MLFGGIEAGGTKFVCGVGNSQGEILDHVTIPTTLPDETIPKVTDYFTRIRERFDFEQIGIASFGPLDLNPYSSTYGYITSTPKAGWSNFDYMGAIASKLSARVNIDTDVNAAALAEYRWGAARFKSPVVYLTIGTGIGGGAIIDGKPLHGLMHPEMGHIRIRSSRNSDDFEGVCPYHKYCLEGLASGPALAARWNIRGQDLPADHPAWKVEAEYLAEGLANIILTLSPEIIVLGGGVMKNDFLIPLIRKEVKQILNGYVPKGQILDPNETYIVPAGLLTLAGLLGAIALVCEP